MNQVNLIGRLTADPQIYTANSGNKYAAVTIAINRGKDDQGNDKGADFPRVYVYGRAAENLCRYMLKGSQIGITGHIRTGSYDDKDGKKVYTTDIIAHRVQFLGHSAGHGSQQAEPQPQYTRTERAQTVPPQYQQTVQPQPDEYMQQGFAALDDDIPF